MRNIWTIANREFRHYFISPIAYIVALLILFTLGIYFLLVLYSISNRAYYGGATAPPTTGMLLDFISFLLLFAVPALTMRLLADEHRTGTLELLLTSPVHDWELIVGKWLGAFLFLLTIIAITLLFPIILNTWLVDPGIDRKLMFSNYLGLILLTGAFLAIGTAISSIFKNQFAALFATMVTLFLLWWVIGWPGIVMPSGGEIFSYLSMSTHFDAFIKGSVSLADIVYYLSWTVLGLFVGTAAIEMRRWQ